MKKKFLVLTLCFALIFSSINLKKSYADGGIISAPMLATVSALAVATGVVIKNSDDLYDLGRMFYDYVDNHNDMTWSTIQALFASSVAVGSNKLVSVNGGFLDVVKDFFDTSFSVPNDIVVSGIPTKIMLPFNTTTNYTFSMGDALIHISYVSSTQYHYRYNLKVIDCTGSIVHDQVSSISNSVMWFGFEVGASAIFLKYSYNPDGSGVQNSGQVKGDFADILKSSAATFPYTGGYTWDNVNDRLNENNELPLPIPGNIGNLVGQTSEDFWDNTDNLVGNGSLSLPTVDNPSISVDTTVDSFVGSTDSDVPDVGNPSLPSLPSWGSGLDFSPITQGVFTDKFPFCLAKDVKDIISVFDVPSRNLKEPIFKIPIVGEELVLDFTEFKLWFDIVKFFVLIGFIISLIVLTRGIIG